MMRKKIKRHYAEKFKLYELTWSPYFHYGIFEGSEDLITAHKRTLDVIAKMADLTPRSKLIDVGCGIGSAGLYLTEKYGCSIVGIDPVENQIVYSREKAKTQNLSHLVSFQLGNAEKIPLEDARFDIAISNEVFCHIENKPRALAECHRVLKPGGCFVLSDLFDKSNGIETRSFHQYLKHIQPMLNQEEYKGIVLKSDFRMEEVKDLSLELPKNYEKALALLESNRFEIIERFGEEEYQVTKDFYELCLTNLIKENIGWLMFKCRWIIL